MDKRVEGRMVTTRSGTSVGVQGRSPAVNVINVTRRPDGGIVSVEMKRQEGMHQEGNSRPSAVAALPLRGAVPINVYQHPAYAADQQSNMMSVQVPRKVSPNASIQLHNSDVHPGSGHYHQFLAPRQRMPAVQHFVPHSSTLSDQQRVAPTSSHVVRPVADPHMLHSQVNDAVLPEYVHVLSASDIRLMTSNNTASPSLPVYMEGTNGSVSYRPAQIGSDLPASSGAVGRVFVDPKSGNVAPQLISRLPGLQYDVIPPRSDGPSEAERKVAVLTQQLENEMRLTTSQGSSPWQQPADTFSQYRSPPPYYGPHITANTKVAVPSNAASNCATSVAGGDSDLASKKAGDAGVHHVVPVTSLSSGLSDVQQPQPSVHHSSDLDASTECYGKPVLV